MLKIIVFDERRCRAATGSTPTGALVPDAWTRPVGGRSFVTSKRTSEAAPRTASSGARSHIDVEQFRSRSISSSARCGRLESTADTARRRSSRRSRRRIRRPRMRAARFHPAIAQRGSVETHPLDAATRRTSRASAHRSPVGPVVREHHLQEGDTIFVPKAEKFFVTGQVRSPGAYTHERA